jgi:hypothetical protein
MTEFKDQLDDAEKEKVSKLVTKLTGREIDLRDKVAMHPSLPMPSRKRSPRPKLHPLALPAR